MSTNENDQTDTLENIRLRLKSLRESLSDRAQMTQKRRRTLFCVGIALVALSVVALTSLTTMAFKLDAHALTQVGRLEIEQHLPDGRAGLATHLKSQAPAVVKHTLSSLLDLLPQLRTVLVRDLEKNLSQVTAEGEKLLRAQMETSLNTTKASLDEQFPDSSDAEKLEKVMAVVAADFSKNMKHSIDEIYPQYVAQMDRVHSFVHDLCTVKENQLTKKEKIQKELIRTLLKLMVIEQNRTKSI